jgi:hypothetical protein
MRQARRFGKAFLAQTTDFLAFGPKFAPQFAGLNQTNSRKIAKGLKCYKSWRKREKAVETRIQN